MKMNKEEDEEKNRRPFWQSFIRKAVLAQNTDSNENCSESLSIENDIDQSLNIENNVEMRIKAVENTKSLRENTETKIFITGIGNMSHKESLNHAQNYPHKDKDFKNSFQSTSCEQIFVKAHSWMQKTI